MRYLFLVLTITAASCGHTIYVVRHAEKAAPTSSTGSDVPLTPYGQERAVALKETLAEKKITAVYSTNTNRTKSTGQPTAAHFGLTITSYGPKPDSAFIRLLKSQKKNILVVGHSNTIDDVANMLAASTVVAGDLPETEFDNLYMLKKKGRRYVFSRKSYGAPNR